MNYGIAVVDMRFAEAVINLDKMSKIKIKAACTFPMFSIGLYIEYCRKLKGLRSNGGDQ